MLTITEHAKAALDAFFTDRPRAAVRIYRAPGGAEGPRLALVLDNPTEDDRVFTQEGYTFCIHAGLLATVGGVTLDCVDDDFVLRPLNPFAQPAGGCAGCRGGSCGSCGQG